MSIPHMLWRGQIIDLENPDFSGIDILDIAMSLARIPRFCGSTSEPYVIAQHSVHVADLCKPRFKLAALLHDAIEMITNDIPTSCKFLIGRDLLKQKFAPLEQAMAARFHYQYPEPPEVKHADNIAVATEIRDLKPRYSPTATLPPPDPKKIVPLSETGARTLFIKRYHQIIKAQERIETTTAPTPSFSHQLHFAQ